MSLHAETEYYHFQKPDSALATYHIEVTPEPTEHTEMLTWDFPTVSGDAATLEMRWDDTSAPLQLLVEPTRAVTLDPEGRDIFVGSYELDVMPGLGWPTEAELRVTERGDGTLRGWMSFPVHPGDDLSFDLIPAGHDRFHAGLYRDGTLFNVEMGVAFEFGVDDRADTVTLRGIEGTPFAAGARTQAANRF
jgi:hypothetical protein